MAVFANSRGIAHKGSSTGMTIAFPDVCKMMAPPGGPFVPLPYPNIAKTAIAKQQTKVTGGLKTPTPLTSGEGSVGTLGGVATSKNVGNAEFHSSGFNVKMEGKPVTFMGDMHVHNRQNEAAQLRANLDELHRQMRSLSPGNPDKWQAVMQSYAVAASALYVTITDDD